MFKHFTLLLHSCCCLFFCCSVPLWSSSLAIGDVSFSFSEIIAQKQTLKTTKGGIVSIPKLDLVIMAREISCSKNGEGKIERVEAEGDLSCFFRSHLFSGDRLTFDLLKKEGTLYQGRGAFTPFFIGGDTITFFEDGRLHVDHAFMTTSLERGGEKRLQIKTERITVNEGGEGKTDCIWLKAGEAPLFVLPAKTFNTDRRGDFWQRSKIAFRRDLVRITYPFFSRDAFQASFLFDYRWNRGWDGIGGGINTRYDRSTVEKSHSFSTHNYAATKTSFSSLLTGQNKRYRFHGRYLWKSQMSPWQYTFSYDRLSDPYLPNEYRIDTLEYQSVEPMKAMMRRQQGDTSLFSLSSQIRINPFQTVKQDIPHAFYRLHPFPLGSTGILTEHQWNIGAYHYVGAKQRNENLLQEDFHTTRAVMESSFYRPIPFSPFTLTPFLQWQGVAYGNSPSKKAKEQSLFLWGTKASTLFLRTYNTKTHLIEPYCCYEATSRPARSMNDLYILDQKDTWARTESFRFGISQSLTQSNSPFFFFDLYSRALLVRPEGNKKIPEWYTSMNWLVRENWKLRCDTSWLTYSQRLNRLKWGLDYTHSADLAFTAEYRHRKARAWRKADRHNFFLESRYGDEALLHSRHSDPGQVVSGKVCYRLSPDWTVEYETRFGKKNQTKKHYHEQLLSFRGLLPEQWRMRFIVRKRAEQKVEFVFSLQLPLHPPKIAM